VKPQDGLRRQYAAAMEAYLAGGGGEVALERAYELGRQALDAGLGVLDVAVIYHKALAPLVRSSRTADENVATVEKSASFFVESLSPFEMTHRGHRDAQRTLLHLNEMMEMEAKRIAHALHDESGQLLVALRIDLSQLERDLSPPLRKRLRPIQRRLDEIEEQLRRLSHELRPTILDDLGLCPALSFLAEGVSKRTGLEITVEGSTKGRLPVAVETALYRVVQEALTNVMRHAHAGRVKVGIRPEGKMLRCQVEDDGIGFDPSALSAAGNGLGLRGIEERLKALGGSLEIRSSPSHGTALRIEVPLKE
jgi:signal transduction histidine kinase